MRDLYEMASAVHTVARKAEENRLRLLGALAILVQDEVISSSRARELGGMSIEEQRAYLREAFGEEKHD